MDAELVEDALQVGADGGGFYAKPMGNNLVGKPFADHLRHLDFALRQLRLAVRVRCCQR